MMKVAIACIYAGILMFLAVSAGRWVLEQEGDPGLAVTRFVHEAGEHDRLPGLSAQAASPMEGTHEGLLYGRVTTEDGVVYEGRLRWGGDEEALWGNYFNGYKSENPWVAYAPPERATIDLFGFVISGRERVRDGRRPFMARFGDIARIEPRGREILVTLRSGSSFVLDRFSADDVADGLRVWDDTHGIVDLSEWRIRTVELLATPSTGSGPSPLHGTVRTRDGEFTGLLQWDRRASLGSDVLVGRTADQDMRLRFETIRSIERQSGESALVTLLDGRELVLSGTRELGSGNLGIYVDDPRYGRVLVSWEALERLDLHAGGSGPAYDDFAPGRRLAGSVTTRSGRQLAGGLVFDLDEAESTETLDASSRGVNYTIPFERVASIVPRDISAGRGSGRARVSLLGGETLELDRSGDLGEQNAGLLVFPGRGQSPEYVSWSEVERIDLDR